MAKTNANLPVVYTPRSPKAKAIMKLATAVGIWEGVAYLGDKAEGLFESMFDSMEDSGLDPSAVEKMPKTKQQQVIAVELARQGVDIDNDVLQRLPSNIAKGYKTMREMWVPKEPIDFLNQSSALANKRKAQPQTATAMEDDDTDRLKYIRRVSDVCSMLGLSGASRFRQLHEIVNVINTLSEVNVQDAERHEQILGQIR